MTPLRTTLTIAALAVLGLMVAACGITDPYAHRPPVATTAPTTTTGRSTITDPSEPTPTKTGTTARAGVTAAGHTGAASPRQAVQQYTALYINWTAHTIAAHQRQLAELSAGTARAKALQAAGSYRRDPELSHSQAANYGEIVSLAAGRGSERGAWVIVTREHSTGHGDYQGLPATTHVTYAHTTHTRHGWVISQWTPQS